MSWIDKILPSGISRTEGSKRASVPEGVWTKCVKCDAVLYKPDLERNANVCPKCGHHMRIGARARIDLFLDADNRDEIFSEIEPIDRLRFRDKKKYTARLATAQKATGERDALVAMRGSLHSMPVVVVAFEFGFHGGSMGQAVGEKFSRAAQLALAERIPLICFAASGGARMQEALISLMQMAKTSAVIERMHSESVPYVSVMTDPIYGGVSASLALLGDLNIAEPEARAGFAGPNIIEQTIRQKLPKGFQRSEFLLEHGAIDMIVPRLELRDTIARVLAKLTGQAAPLEMSAESLSDTAVAADEGSSSDEDSTADIEAVDAAAVSDDDGQESAPASDESEAVAEVDDGDEPDAEATIPEDGTDEAAAAPEASLEVESEDLDADAVVNAEESDAEDSAAVAEAVDSDSDSDSEAASDEEATGKKPDA